MSNIERYRKIFINNLNLEDTFNGCEIERNKTKNWDSVGHISIISDIEDEFDIMFRTEDILAFRTYEYGLSMLRKYGVEFN